MFVIIVQYLVIDEGGSKNKVEEMAPWGQRVNQVSD